MHVLVVGGTGMLIGVTRWLATQQGDSVSVLSRRAKQLPADGLTERKINAIEVDYQDSDLLRRAISEAIVLHGPIELAVFWIHRSAPSAFQVIVNEITKYAVGPWTLIDVRGGTACLHQESPRVPVNCLYRQIILGLKIEENKARWLTHDEIAKGVIEGIQSGRKHWVVGRLAPGEGHL